MTDSSGTIQARYDYDPYGRATLVSGTNLSDFQYAGYYEHQTSGLNLTKYRAYDSNTAKWLSRDPLAEEGGINLYEYASNNCLTITDPLGLCPSLASLVATNPETTITGAVAGATTLGLVGAIATKGSEGGIAGGG